MSFINRTRASINCFLKSFGVHKKLTKDEKNDVMLSLQMHFIHEMNTKSKVNF